MAKKSKSGSPSSPNAPAMGIEGLGGSADDLGLSLDELSQAYASLLGTGDDPYAPAPDSADGLAEAGSEELVLQGLFAAEQQLRATSDDELDDDSLPDESDAPAASGAASAPATVPARPKRTKVDSWEI